MTGLWFVSAESSAVDLCYCFLALKRTAVGFGHFVFTLGRINTYSAFYQELSFSGGLKIWKLWTLVIATFGFGYIQGMYL